MKGYCTLVLVLAIFQCNIKERLGDCVFVLFDFYCTCLCIFVEQLCVKLESHHCSVSFYDKCGRSLPKGEKFYELIKLATKQRQMMVVVSDKYFRSKWPMMELHAFI